MQQVVGNTCGALRVLLDKLACGLHEQLVNLLERLVLSLVHEEDLVEPADHRNTAVEAECKTGAGECLLHTREVVCDDEGGQEQPSSGSGHTVRAKISGIDLRGDDPGKSGIGTEEEFVEDEACEVESELALKIAFGDMVGGTNEYETDEETRQHSDSPETTAAGFHEEDSGDGAKEEGSATHEGHVCSVVIVETDLRHKHAHVVHDSVDSSKLTQEDHRVGVDNSPASSWFGEEIHPGEPVGAASGDLSLLLFSADLHDEEFLTRLESLNTTNASPDLESLEWFTLVHEVAWRFGHEKYTDTHDGGENEGRAEDVPPVAGNTDEHGSDCVSEDFSKSDVELVEGDQVTTESAFDGLGNVDGDCATLETDTGTKNDTSSDDHTIVDGTGLECTTDGVEDTRDEDSPATTEIFVARRDEESTGDSY